MKSSIEFKTLYYPDADFVYNSNTSNQKTFDHNNLTTDESFTLVCDGAGITCSNHVTMASSPSNYYSPNSPMTEIPLSYTGFILLLR